MFQPSAEMNSELYAAWIRFYPEFKFWGTFGGILWTLFKGVGWIKSIRTNDLASIQNSVVSMENGLEKQTLCIVGELKELRTELREDLRSLTNAFIIATKGH